MTFDSFQENVREHMERRAGSSAWELHFAEQEIDREWLVIVIVGSSFASLVVSADLANAADVVEQLERMITTQQERAPPGRRRAPNTVRPSAVALDRSSDRAPPSDASPPTPASHVG